MFVSENSPNHPNHPKQWPKRASPASNNLMSPNTPHQTPQHQIWASTRHFGTYRISHKFYLICSLMETYLYTSTHLHCVWEQQRPWRDCADAQASVSVWLLVVPNLMYMRKGVNGDYWLANYGHIITRLANIGPLKVSDLGLIWPKSGVRSASD